MPDVCKSIRCDRLTVARSMCHKHWKIWRKGGDIHAKSKAEKAVQERFMERVDQQVDGCWIWQGPVRGNEGMKYGSVWYQGGTIGAHQLSVILFKRFRRADLGSEDSLVLHHCDVPLCVNPEHLYVGSRSENSRDKIARGRCAHANKTHCPNGHKYTPENTYISKQNMRSCKACHADRERVRREKYRAANAA